MSDVKNFEDLGFIIDPIRRRQTQKHKRINFVTPPDPIELLN